MTGFEPVMRESKSLALPLGYTPILYPPQTHNTKHEKKKEREKSGMAVSECLPAKAFIQILLCLTFNLPAPNFFSFLFLFNLYFIYSNVILHAKFYYFMLIFSKKFSNNQVK